MPSCPKCGCDAVPGAVFCARCGDRLAVPVASPPPDDPYLGTTLKGMYFVQQKIGDGGMGQVYRALHVALDAPVAVKIVKRGLIADPGVVGRFQREARAASRLRHPNVIAVTDFGQTDDGTLFMVMEYVTGKNLARVIAEEGPLSERRVIHIAAQVLSALSEAHANQILHRDLKPENVMVESRRDAPDGVKVLDFGIAKLQVRDAPASTLTQAGLVCGTPGYMSPEQLSGDDLDVRSDLYAVGVVLYEMLTKKLPFDVHVPMEILHRQLSGPAVPPGTRRGAPVSAELEALVMRALSPAREGRPESADAMRTELLACPVAADLERPPSGERPARTDVLPRRDSPVATAAPGGAPARLSSTSRPPTAPTMRTPVAGTRSRTTAAPGSVTPTAPGSVTPGTGSAMTPPAVTPAPAGDPAPAVPTPTRGTSRVTPPRPLTLTGLPEADAELTRDVVQRIERRAVPFLGPIARVLVKKASSAATTAGALCEAMALFIPSDADRRTFLVACARELATPSAPTPASGTVAGTRARNSGNDVAAAPPPGPVTWDPVVLERVRAALAEHVGPLARVIVQRAATSCRDADALCEALAREIPAAPDRQAFLRKARRAIDGG